MYTFKRTLIWTALLCVTAWAQESASQARAPKLSFEISDQSLRYPPREGTPQIYDIVDGSASPKPFAYAAAISTNDSRHFRGFSFKNNYWGDAEWLKVIAERQDVSNAQKAFLLKGQLADALKRTMGASYRVIENPKPARQLLLYAVSIEDAQKMAQAYYDAAYQKLEEYRRSAKNVIAWCEQEISKRQKELDDAERILQNAEQEFADLKKNVPYHSTEEAKAALAEFNRMLNALTVEISGIEATIKAIGDYRSDKRTSPQLLIRLEDMLIEEAIKRTAAEARQKTASDLQANATKYIDLQARISQKAAQRSELNKTISSRQTRLDGAKSDLANMVVPQILNNQVTIHPVH